MKNKLIWFFSVVFLIGGVGNFLSISGLASLFLGLILLPVKPLQEFLAKYRITGGMKIGLLVALFACMCITAPETEPNDAGQTTVEASGGVDSEEDGQQTSPPVSKGPVSTTGANKQEPEDAKPPEQPNDDRQEPPAAPPEDQTGGDAGNDGQEPSDPPEDAPSENPPPPDDTSGSDGNTQGSASTGGETTGTTGGQAQNQDPAPQSPPASEPEEEKYDYVLNTNTMKFHLPKCHHVDTIEDHNRQDFNGTREDVINMGYDPCGGCHP